MVLQLHTHTPGQPGTASRGTARRWGQDMKTLFTPRRQQKLDLALPTEGFWGGDSFPGGCHLVGTQPSPWLQDAGGASRAKGL